MAKIVSEKKKCFFYSGITIVSMGSSCTEQSSKEHVNRDHCSLNNCPSPFRMCLHCLLQGANKNPLNICFVVNSKTGCCKHHNSHGPKTLRTKPDKEANVGKGDGGDALSAIGNLTKEFLKDSQRSSASGEKDDLRSKKKTIEKGGKETEMKTGTIIVPTTNILFDKMNQKKIANGRKWRELEPLIEKAKEGELGPIRVKKLENSPGAYVTLTDPSNIPARKLAAALEAGIEKVEIEISQGAKGHRKESSTSSSATSAKKKEVDKDSSTEYKRGDLITLRVSDILLGATDSKKDPQSLDDLIAKIKSDNYEPIKVKMVNTETGVCQLCSHPKDIYIRLLTAAKQAGVEEIQAVISIFGKPPKPAKGEKTRIKKDKTKKKGEKTKNLKQKEKKPAEEKKEEKAMGASTTKITADEILQIPTESFWTDRYLNNFLAAMDADITTLSEKLSNLEDAKATIEEKNLGSLGERMVAEIDEEIEKVTNLIPAIEQWKEDITKA